MRRTHGQPETKTMSDVFSVPSDPSILLSCPWTQRESKTPGPLDASARPPLVSPTKCPASNSEQEICLFLVDIPNPFDNRGTEKSHD